MKNKFVKILTLIICIMIFDITLQKKTFANSFYDLTVNSIEGDKINFKDYTNKVVLIVNVASYCGFTKQYNELQNLWENYKDQGLVVLGVPSQSFNQEKDSEKEIKEFCEVNFGINFPMTEILEVKGDNAHDIFRWASNSYGNSAVPKWNFHKILVGKDGKIVDTYVSFTKPNSKKIVSKIEDLLK